MSSRGGKDTSVATMPDGKDREAQADTSVASVIRCWNAEGLGEEACSEENLGNESRGALSAF